MTDKFANLRASLAALKLGGPVSTDPGKWNAATDALDVELVAELLAERDAMVQAQPAAVSDATINRVVYEHTKLNPNQADDLDLLLGIRKAVRAILALRPQAVPMTEEQKAAPKLIGWRTENFLWETDDVDKARNWEPNIGVLPIFEGDPNTKLGSRGITAQADGEGE